MLYQLSYSRAGGRFALGPQRRNARYMASGKLFEQRFSAFAIDSDAYCGAGTAYIELNPERARP